jgi:hypothetical protein
MAEDMSADFAGLDVTIDAEDSEGTACHVSVVVDLVDFGSVAVVTTSTLTSEGGESVDICLSADQLRELRTALDQAIERLP